jgi:chromosome segregation ATPase
MHPFLFSLLLATPALANVVPSPPIYAPPPITDERNEAIAMTRNLEFRLTTLRATLFEERRWNEEVRDAYYLERRDALQLEESLDDSHASLDDLHQVFQSLTRSHATLRAALDKPSTVVSRLQEQIDNRMEELKTLIYTIPD